MLPLAFFGQNLHFALSIFTALVFFAVFWLYFDAWASKTPKHNKDIFKWAGFLLVSISFLVHSTLIEQTELGRSALGHTSEIVATLLRLAGFVGIIIGLVIDPPQAVPQTGGIEAEFKQSPALFGTSSAFGFIYGLPAAAAAIAVLYWRRATIGLERHLKPVAIAFGFLFVFELISLTQLWQDTTNPNLFNLVKAFGPLWFVSHTFLLLGSVALGRWVWHYLTERFLSQLFMIFTSVVLAIFLLTTVSFTYLLMKNVQNDSLDNLVTAANVLNYALDSKKAETKAVADSVALNPNIAQAVLSKDHKALVALTSSFLESNKESSLVITTASAQVVLRAESPDRWGDSISSDPLVRKALIGEASSTVVSTQAVLAPTMTIKSAVPIRAGDTIIGTVSTAVAADNNFVDGIKKATGLESAIYSSNTLSATTFVSPDGKTRLVGTKQNSGTVKDKVLTKGQTFKGSLTISNRSFLAVYKPIKDVNNNIVGMLFIGRPQSSVLRSANHSIELTFIIAAVLMLLAILPSYVIAKHLAKQLG